MSELIYIDTNVWMDYFYSREDSLLSPSEIAYQILQRSIQCEFTIIISEILLYELEKYVPNIELKEVLYWLKPKIFHVTLSTTNQKDAEKIALHYPDNLHMFIAQKYNAIMVSNDKEMQIFGAIPSRDL